MNWTANDDENRGKEPGSPVLSLQEGELCGWKRNIRE
jgi:hypothetical protein